MFQEGDIVVLNVPENPRIHGHKAVVTKKEPWGALVTTKATATGQFRALNEEMVSHSVGTDNGYNGIMCDRCGSFNVTRAGACVTCLDCGTSGGCG